MRVARWFHGSSTPILSKPMSAPRIDLPPDTPRWLEPTLRTVGGLADLEPDWDSHGARAIDPRVLREAIDLLRSLMRGSTPAPAVVPLADGGIQLEWHAVGLDLEIAVHRFGPAEVLCEEPGGESRDGHLPAVFPHVRAAIEHLSR
jgi:hypothetical protein